MNDFCEDVGLGIYRSIDDINHFKLRVVVQRTVPASFPINEAGKNDLAESLELLQLQRNGKMCRAETIFYWQEKISKEEEKELRSSAILRRNGLQDSESCKIKLFTYVDSEITSNPQFSSYFQGSSNCLPQTLRKRTLWSSSTNKTYQRPYVLDERDVVQFGSSKHKFDFAGQSMAIMANIKQDGCDSTELQLCLLHFDSSGTLIVIPDFSKSHYYIRTADYGTYEFTVENASNSPHVAETQKEKNFIKKVSEKHWYVLKSLVGNQFDMPSSKSLMFHLNGEIICGKNFSASNIFVRYFFQLPEEMVAIKEEYLTATTHSCKSKCISGVTMAYFGYPFSLSTEMELEKFKGTAEPVIHMVIEVCSVDSWGVCRSVGYGYCDIVVHPGEYHHEINTWRFLPQTFIGALKEFFIGGIPSIEDLSYVHIPKDHQAKELNKYGTKTEASGTVILNLHTLLQFGCEASSNYFIHKQEVTSNY